MGCQIDEPGPVAAATGAGPSFTNEELFDSQADARLRPSRIYLRGKWVADKESIMSKGSIVLKPACIKTLAAVEAHPERSNQHEFNGVAALKQMFGTEDAKYKTTFSVRGEDKSYEADVTWYDSRGNHPTRSEHRLYFQSNPVMDRAQEGDNIIIGFVLNKLHCILIPNDPTPYAGWTLLPS